MALALRAAGDTRGGSRPVEIHGLLEMRRELKAIDARWPREVRKINRDVGDAAAEYARGGADSHGGVVAKAAYSIVGAGTQTGARVRWGGRGFEFADGAFFGALQYQRFEPWIGNAFTGGWEIGTGQEGPGRGPYGLGAGITPKVVEELAGMYLDRLTELLDNVRGLEAETA